MILAVYELAWLLVIGWVAHDAARRHRSWFGWSFLVGNTSVLGLIVWLIVRRRSPSETGRLSPSWNALLWVAGVPVVLINLLVAAFIVTFLFQVARVDGQAMGPTLNNQ